MSNLIPQIIRTLVPILVGWVVAKLAAAGLAVDHTVVGAISANVGVAAAWLYYASVSWLERKVPAFGWLLGVARTPVYGPEPGNPTALVNVIPQIARTYVPVLVGWAFAKLAVAGLQLDPSLADSVTADLTALAASLYYIVVAGLERKVPWVGWLLGIAAVPVYSAKHAATTA